MPLFFVLWYTDVVYDINIAPKLSMCMVMGYSTTTPINNKISWGNSISQRTSVIDEYSASVTDSGTVLWICKLQSITTPLIRKMYPVTLFLFIVYVTVPHKSHGPLRFPHGFIC